MTYIIQEQIVENLFMNCSFFFRLSRSFKQKENIQNKTKEAENRSKKQTTPNNITNTTHNPINLTEAYRSFFTHEPFMNCSFTHFLSIPTCIYPWYWGSSIRVNPLPDICDLALMVLHSSQSKLIQWCPKSSKVRNC